MSRGKTLRDTSRDRTIPVILDRQHLALLGRVRMALGHDGLPVTTAAAVRAAIAYMAEAFSKQTQDDGTKTA